ncbi:hypothetical protein BDB00DRAFT_814386 [Zychaea mexicana]|uniref:uncharacterized protein n=1 Tax=Zychaea mexicana TaxID=64656 RepID=UPI0022FE786D|nr:uncharacterized protein BDB00DRAFT_814386 [Zychaea mexicana]KAI9495367.1 hypothetical protein BDB00DRAFT_814386 [Zychaea mexicana]
MQEGGPREAIEAMRKRLKHGTTQQKLRVIDVLKLLMENTSEKFHRQLLSNDKMRERLDLIVSSSTEDTKVRKALLSVLGAWAVKYKNEPGMHVLAELYESGRKKLNLPRRTGSGSAATTTTPRSPATAEATPAMPPRPTQQQQPSPPTSSQQKRQSLPPTAHTTEVRTKPRSSSTAGSGGNSSNNRTTTTQRTFNLEAAKPKIIQEVALANQNTNNLVNALKFINTSEDRWEIDLQHDARLQDYRQRCEDSKKKIVRYARLVEDEEWIGTLLATNEELLKALQMYETMSVGEVPTNMPSTPPSPLSPQHTRSPPPPPSQRQEETMRELAGLQLSSSSTSSPPPTTDSNLSRASAESENPFADPFADPVTPAHEDVGGDKKRLGELVL